MVQRLCIYSALLLFVVVAVGCGKLSTVVDLNFPEQISSPAAKKSHGSVGLQSGSGARNNGAFRLDAGVGTQLSSAVKTDGAFKFYGGIQGQVVSK